MAGIVESSVSQQGMGPKQPLAKLLAAGIKVLSQPQIQEAIMDAAASESPEEDLSDISKSLLDAMDEKAGGKIPPDAMATFALELVETMADLLRAASGSDDETLGPKTMKRMLEKSMEQAGQEGQTTERPAQPPVEQPGIVEQEMVQ